MGVLTAHLSTPIVLRMGFRLSHWRLCAHRVNSALADGFRLKRALEESLLQLKMGVLDAATAPPSCWPPLYRSMGQLVEEMPVRRATLLNAPSDSIKARPSTSASPQAQAFQIHIGVNCIGILQKWMRSPSAASATFSIC